mmetsp:Transcript_3700/g.11136  ORF Transcript_3700/g.11136 Transcript_3700/m.11136 type:complete len:148 (-) Transcript_3700:23-466(-)
MVFGASFTASNVIGYNTEKVPIYKDVPVTRTKGWLWWRSKEQSLEHRKVGEEEVKTPVFKSMSSSQVGQCMDMMELKACEKVLETADGVPTEPAPGGPPSLALSLLAPTLNALLPTLLGLAAVAVAQRAMPKRAKGAGLLLALLEGS